MYTYISAAHIQAHVNYKACDATTMRSATPLT